MKRKERIWLALTIWFMWMNILLNMADAPLWSIVIAAALMACSGTMFADMWREDE